MESRTSLSTSIDSKRELNGSNVQEHWSRSNRVSSAHVVQSHFKLKQWWWWLKCWRDSPGAEEDVHHYLLRLLVLAGHASCGQEHQEGPVPVLHSQGFLLWMGNEGTSFFFSFLFYITWWEHVLWLQERTIFDGSCITSSHMKIIYTIISLLYFNVSLSVCVRNQVITLKITLSFNLYLTCWASVSVEHRCLGKCSVFFFF